MKVAWTQLGGAACASAFALLMSAPVQAADQTAGMTSVAAEELDKRSKQAQQAQREAKGAMSDSAVRVLMTYAFSIIPAETPGPDGKPVKTDKSDPKKYFIPTEDARRVIRAATRSAYAEICGLPELARTNYDTMMKGEEGRKTWSAEQLVMINALHVFSVSYFTGNIKITAQEVPDDKGAAQAQGDASAVSKGATPEEGGENARVIIAEPPKCPPAQKQKVTKAINAYVKSAQAASPKGAE
jgi:hypothetical protein